MPPDDPLTCPPIGIVRLLFLKGLEVNTISDLRRFELSLLETRFGRHGVRLYKLARGIDESPVVPDRPTQSISAEDTAMRPRNTSIGSSTTREHPGPIQAKACGSCISNSEASRPTTLPPS
jgi:nucleotidyltransferase/DNA polymerase involved in DNA repair